MKFKANLKTFVKFVNKFLTKGYFTVNGSDDVNIKEANIYALPTGRVTLVGGDIPGSVFCRGSIEAEVLEEGSDFIANLKDFIEILKMMVGETVTVTFGTTVFEVTDGISSYGDELSARSCVDDYDAWNRSAKFNDEQETIFFEDNPGSNNPGYLYTKWFGVDDTKPLNSIHDKCIKNLGVDRVVLSQDDTFMKIEITNPHRNKHLNTNIPLEWCEDAGIHEMRSILPIFRALEGKAQFYYYITSSGNSRYWIVNTADDYVMEWMVRND